MNLRVGELAERAGVTVRTLHHYDEIGLLRAQRTPAGHRRYGATEIERLQQITSLRALGLSLDAIGEALDAPDIDPAEIVARQRAALGTEARRLGALANRLDGLERLLRRRAHAGEPIAPDTFLTLTRLMTDIQTHYTPEQLQQLAERATPSATTPSAPSKRSGPGSSPPSAPSSTPPPTRPTHAPRRSSSAGTSSSACSPAATSASSGRSETPGNRAAISSRR